MIFIKINTKIVLEKFYLSTNNQVVIFRNRKARQIFEIILRFFIGQIYKKVFNLINLNRIVTSTYDDKISYFINFNRI